MKTLYGIPHLLFDENNGGEGGGGGGGGGGGNTPDPKEKEISELRATLENEKKAKQKLQGDLSKLSGELDQLKKSGMKGSENFKQLAETYEAENKSLKEEVANTKKGFFDTLRVSAVKEEAAKLGLRPESMQDIEFMDMDTLEIEKTEANLFKVKGADSWAKDLKKIRPHWFKQPDAPKVNTGGGNEGDAPRVDGEITVKQYQDAFSNRLKDPKTWAVVNQKFREQQQAKRRTKTA
jgi:hypothetical protein